MKSNGTVETRTSVRDAAPGERSAMRDVLGAAYGQYRTAMPAGVFERYLIDVLDLDRHAQAGVPLVAEVGGRVVGTAVFYPDASTEGVGWPSGWAGVRLVGVDPAWRGAGIARRIMAECERRAILAGAEVFALHTADFMTAALALYRSLGYRRSPHVDVDVTAHLGLDTVNPLIALAFTRELSGPLSRRPRGVTSHDLRTAVDRR